MCALPLGRSTFRAVRKRRRGSLQSCRSCERSHTIWMKWRERTRSYVGGCRSRRRSRAVQMTTQRWEDSVGGEKEADTLKTIHSSVQTWLIRCLLLGAVSDCGQPAAGCSGEVGSRERGLQKRQETSGFTGQGPAGGEGAAGECRHVTGYGKTEIRQSWGKTKLKLVHI